MGLQLVAQHGHKSTADMTELVTASRTYLLEPRRLILVAALLVMGGIISGYLSVYDQADRTLALRQGPPNPVAVQYFDSAQNVGPAREVVIQAEAALDDPLVLTLRDRTPRTTVMAIPLHELSDVGAATIVSSNDQARTALGAQVARRTEIAPERPAAYGVLILELGANFDAEAFDPRDFVTTFGQGRFGTAIEINGQTGQIGEIGLMVDGALSVQNMELAETFLAVTPFMEGRLEVLEAEVALVEQGRNFFWMGSIISLVALGLSLGGFGVKDARRKLLEDERAAAKLWTSGPSTSSHFEPLPTQEEVNAADLAERPVGDSKRAARAVAVSMKLAARRVSRARRRN